MMRSSSANPAGGVGERGDEGRHGQAARRAGWRVSEEAAGCGDDVIGVLAVVVCRFGTGDLLEDA